ncbi:TPA: hypothetical protein SI878_004411 [Salmonella enterica]|nr:hypothetical protein [Salmonella enterica]
MATYSFNGKQYNFPDDVSQDEALEFIDQQAGGSNAPTTPQEAPQQAQPQSNTNPQPTPTEAPTEPQSALERGFNYAGNVAATGGRIIAGGVADLANVGVGALNAIGQGVQSASNAITGENGQYQPIAPAGYGELDQYLMPQTTGEKIAAGAVPYIAGGEIVAPMKAAEGAGMISRAATSIANQLPASITGALSENNQGDVNAIARDTAINAVAGATLEKVGGAALDKIRNVLPESLGGFSQAEKAATVANPDYVNSVLQGGNQEAQQTFRTGTTDANGNSILLPSQALNADQGAKYIRAEQRDLTRGTNSEYAQRLEAQKEGASLEQAAQNTISPIGGAGALQQAAQDTTQAFKDRASTLYNESKQGAQQILDNAPVKITNLKMPETKTLAQQHLDANAATGNINLNAETRRTLTQFNKADLNNINTLDKWKRTLNEKAQKAYRSGDYTSYDALNQVKNSFKDETDKVISAIDPKAGSLWRDADKFHSVSVGDFGNKSILGKIAGKENTDLAANSLVQGQNAGYNTDQIVAAMRDAVNRGDMEKAQQLSQQLGQGLGEATRETALRAGNTGANFSATRFANALHKLEPQAQAANDLAAIGGAVNDQAALNNALQDVVATQRNRAKVAQPSNLVSQLAGRATGGGLGSLIGGTPGAVIGQEVGGRVSNAISQGLLDRLAGTVKRGNEYVDYLSKPENAQAVADVLAQRGASLDTASAKEVKGIIDGLTKSSTATGLAAMATPAAPATQAAAPVTTPAEPEPEQKAQSAKADRFAGVSPQAVDLYKAVAGAETGGLDNRFIRTKAAESGVSTAYGPAQITGTLAKDFLDKRPLIFTEDERKYLKRLISQAEKMKKAPANDPVYGYGGVGELSSPEDQKLYAQVAVKMLDDKYKSTHSLNKTVTGWRGNSNDKAYFNKVRNNYRQAMSQRKSWSAAS